MLDTGKMEMRQSFRELHKPGTDRWSCQSIIPFCAIFKIMDPGIKGALMTQPNLVQ